MIHTDTTEGYNSGNSAAEPLTWETLAEIETDELKQAEGLLVKTVGVGTWTSHCRVN